MGIKKIADELMNIQYPFDLSDEIIELAKQNNIVVVFGASDDLVELRGAVFDDVGAWNGATLYINRYGMFENDCDCRCQHWQAAKNACKKIQVVWNQGNVSWQYKTTIPHETFNIYEGEELYCVGIVFSLSELG